jgi:hypothetical protein
MKLACPCGGLAIALSRYEPSKSYKAQKAFDCGHGVINNFVARTLKQQTQRNLSVAYALTDDDDSFIGFCTLMAASIGRTDLAATDPPSLPIAVHRPAPGVFERRAFPIN